MHFGASQIDGEAKAMLLKPSCLLCMAPFSRRHQNSYSYSSSTPST